MRRSPRTTQSTDKRTAYLPPKSFAEVQEPSIIPPHVGINETLTDFWSPERHFSDPVTNSEPLSFGTAHLPSNYDTTGLSDQTESMSSFTSPSTVTTEIERTSPSTSLQAGLNIAHPSVISSNNVPDPSIANVMSRYVSGRKDLLISTPSSAEDRSTIGTLRYLRHSTQPTSGAVLRAALPLFQSSFSLSSTHSRSPNPLASTLARDTLLTYAHRIFKSPFQPVPGLAASSVVCEPSSPQHPYNTLLLPLLRNLKLLHPKHIPILLLFGCVCHAVGDYAGSLEQNQEILNIDKTFVSELQQRVHQ